MKLDVQAKKVNAFTGKIEYGHHFVLLYRDEDSISNSIATYISYCFDHNMKVMYITGDSSTESIKQQLKKLKLPSGYLDSGQLLFIDSEDAYSKDGDFNPDSMISLIEKEVKIALDEGFDGLGISGEISWVLNYEQGIKLILEYEWKLDERIFDKYPVSALCRYNMDRFTNEMIVNIIQLHPYVMLGSVIYDNPYYLPAKAYEEDRIDEFKVDVWLRNIMNYSMSQFELQGKIDEASKKQKVTEEMLNNFYRLIKVAPIPIMLHTEDGRVLDVSQEWTNLSGYELEDIPTLVDWTKKAYGEDSFEGVLDFISKLYTLPESSHDGIFTIHTINNEKRLWDFYSSYIGDLPIGKRVCMSAAIDITDKEKEAKRRKHYKKVADVYLNITSQLLVLLSESGHVLLINEAGCKILEDTEENILGKNWIKHYILQEDKDEMRKVFNEIKQSSFNLEQPRHTNRIISAKGNVRILKWKNSVITENNTRMIVASGEDLTDILQSQKVSSYHQELSKTYFETMNNLLVILDKDGNITMINRKGTELLGGSKSELIGRNWIETFILSEEKDEIKRIHKDGMENSENFETSFENKIKTLQGEVHYFKWSNSLIKDINGNITGVLCSGIDITADKKHEEELISIGYEDALTSLYNRRYFEEQLKEMDTDENLPMAIVMGDVNGLKLINDAFGHNSGDKVLINAANCMLEEMPKNALLARIGGDEFAFVLPNTEEKEADKIIKKIELKSSTIKIESIELSISFGLGMKTESNSNIKEVYQQAEDNMYRTKLSKIPSMRSGAIETIISTLNEKDKNSEVHSQNVATYAERFAVSLELSSLEIGEVKAAGLLHDIGKIIIPNEILNKVGLLETKEYEKMKTHAEIGYRILNSTANMRDIANVVLYHHEHWDGNGYPQGLSGNQIPLLSRIVTIADAYDAMTSKRTYRPILSPEDALQEIVRCSGSHFDPDLVTAFTEHFEEITKG